MLELYQNAFGRAYPFQLFEKDGITPRDVTGMTLIWRFKSLSDPTILKSLTCTPSDPVNGKFYAVMTTDITGTVDNYQCQIEVSQNTVLLDPSEPFTVAVLKSSAVSG